MKPVFLENLVKNITIIILLFIGYSQIQTSFPLINTLDKGSLGSFLVAVSILAVTACFGNFAFTYEKVEYKKFTSRLLAHLTTGILMLLIGLSLEMTSTLTQALIGNFPIFNLSLLLLYIASVLYDFWDLKRAELK